MTLFTQMFHILMLHNMWYCVKYVSATLSVPHFPVCFLITQFVSFYLSYCGAFLQQAGKNAIKSNHSSITHA